MEIHQSAHRHGVDSEDIHHAVRNALVVVDVYPQSDPPGTLVAGPNRAGNPTEIVMLELADDRLMVIHAMKARPAFDGLLGEDDA